MKDVSVAGGRGGSENEAAEGVSSCGLDVECDADCGFDDGACGVGGCALGEGACGVDGGVFGYRCGECPAVSGDCPVSESCPGECPAPGGCYAASAAGDDSLTVGEAARLFGDSVVRAVRERGGELRAAYDALSDPDFASGLDWRTLQDRETGRVRRNIRWERAGSRRRVEPAREPVPRLSWDGVEARAAVRRGRHEVARALAGLARAVNSGVDPLDDERM